MENNGCLKPIPLDTEDSYYILGRLWAIAEKAHPTLWRHYYKLSNHPIILYVEMFHSQKVRHAFEQPDNMALAASMREPPNSRYATPYQSSMMVMGKCHQEGLRKVA